jgi:hypothetical protein
MGSACSLHGAEEEWYTLVCVCIVFCIPSAAVVTAAAIVLFILFLNILSRLVQSRMLTMPSLADYT